MVAAIAAITNPPRKEALWQQVVLASLPAGCQLLNAVLMTGGLRRSSCKPKALLHCLDMPALHKLQA